jgi:hypothetical protein
MPGVSFEPIIPVFGSAKSVHAFDSAATAIACNSISSHKFIVLRKETPVFTCAVTEFRIFAFRMPMMNI